MVFASTVFVFLFLPLVLIFYFVAPRSMRNVVLLVFSILFYAWGEAQYVPLVLVAIVFNWAVGLMITRVQTTRRRTAWLVIGVIGGLSVLGYLKYANFAVENGNIVLVWLGIASFPIPGVLLPRGVSFFTFHAISYLVDIYRKSAAPESHLPNYALYILLFPQLIAGPIIRWKQICNQFRDRQESVADFAWGANRFVFGLAKKMLIANP